jgi:Mu transposase-like protein
VQTRRVSNDALVTVGAARYSVPVEFVGQTVSVHEGLGYYEFFHHQRLIARHQKADRHSVVMEPAHYAGLLRAASNKSVGTPPPRFDPYFSGLGEVMVRDLKLYEIMSQNEGGAER